MFLRDQGRQEEAVALFREDIEDRLDEELEDFISAAILDEEARAARRSRTRTNQLERQLTSLVLGVCLAALAVSIAAGALLARALTRPIEALISGARAIGDGDLGHRIDYDRKDEFSDLADQFNITAARLEAQRAQLLEVQAGLENEVARRTNQLEDANGRLQRLDQMRMLFLADIGHELRTPLTVLRGEAEVALRGEKTGGGASRDAASASCSSPSRWAGWSRTCCSSPAPRSARCASRCSRSRCRTCSTSR